MNNSLKTIFTCANTYCGFSCKSVVLEKTCTLQVQGTYELLDYDGNSQISEIDHEDWRRYNIIAENSRDKVVFLSYKDAQNFIKNHKLGDLASVIPSENYQVIDYVSSDSRHSKKVQEAITKAGWFSDFNSEVIYTDERWVEEESEETKKINKTLRAYYLGDGHSDYHCGSCLADLSSKEAIDMNDEHEGCPFCGWIGTI